MSSQPRHVEPQRRSQRVDVVVLGTGAAGLAAAVTAASYGASVALVEKGDKVGGTSAWSGGMVWIPNNPHMRSKGIADNVDDARRYLTSMSHGMIEDSLAESFLVNGPEVIRWLEANTPVQFTIVDGMPDYHPEHPGGCVTGGRSLECDLYPFGELGEWAERVTVGAQNAKPYFRMSETPIGSPIPVRLDPGELARRKAGNLRGVGQSLVGRLLRGCLDRGLVPVTSTAGRRLIVEDGTVVGVTVEGPDGELDIRASGGVVLATGGFEWDSQFVRSFLRGPLTRTVSPPTNTGDGLRMSMRIGAALANMREAWWVPIADVENEEGDTYAYLIQADRTKPHSIMVNGAGRRFTNEAANYNSAGAAFHVMDAHTFEYANLPAYMIFDAEFLRRYGFAKHAPGDTGYEWLTSADTIAGLAAKIGVPSDALEETVDLWNKHCIDLVDPDFHRGSSAHDNWWGDPAYKGTPAATLGPVDSAPYYAIEVHAGALGTRGGPRTGPDGEVLDVDGEVIPGLYAAGNVMASPLGMTYGGGGGTLACGLVFGHLAGRHAAQRAAG